MKVCKHWRKAGVRSKEEDEETSEDVGTMIQVKEGGGRAAHVEARGWEAGWAGARLTRVRLPRLVGCSLKET